MKPSTLPDRLWSVDQAAHFLGTAPITVRRLIWDGKLKARKVGRVIRIDPRDVAKVGEPIKTYAGSKVGDADV